MQQRYISRIAKLTQSPYYFCRISKYTYFRPVFFLEAHNDVYLIFRRLRMTLPACGTRLKRARSLRRSCRRCVAHRARWRSRSTWRTYRVRDGLSDIIRIGFSMLSFALKGLCSFHEDCDLILQYNLYCWENWNFTGY